MYIVAGTCQKSHDTMIGVACSWTARRNLRRQMDLKHICPKIGEFVFLWLLKPFLPLKQIVPGLFVFVLCIWTRARQRSGGRAQLNHPSALFPLRLDDCLHLPGFIWVLRGFCHTGCNYETSPHCCVYLRRAGAEIR